MVVTTVDSNSIRTLTFNRPEALNAFNDLMRDEVTSAILNAAADDTVKILVITGTGRAFSAGMDLNPGDDAYESRYSLADMFDAFLDFPKPIILAINGIGVGFGCTIAGLADMVFMANNARLRAPFSSLGLTAEAGSTITFPQLIGYQKAFWTLLSSEWISAEESKNSGLAFETTDPDDLMKVVYTHAGILATQPLVSLITTKDLLMNPRREALREAYKRENSKLFALMGGPANLEAIIAFKENREPDFSNM
jgi:enoyl-CoA hydratase/carnithine racemase